VTALKNPPARAGRSIGTATSSAAPERARWPRLAAAPQPGLRSMLPRGYVGFTEATTPRQLVLPATTFVPLVVKLLDSAHRPPAFVMGARGSSLVLEGDCAPSYLEVVLSPLGAYRVLGLPMAELGGQLVDLVEVLGAAGGGAAARARGRLGLGAAGVLGGGRCRSVGWPVRLGGAAGLGAGGR
jgi:hypothetical protein